jgi:hypothetical protein
VSLQGKKLGVLVSARKDQPNFTHAIKLAETALENGVDVYLYCIDEAVPGILDPAVQALKTRGAKLYACAYGAHRRRFPLSDHAMFAGLTIVHDLIADTDRFIAFP